MTIRMPVYQFKREQKLNTTMEKAWDFISNPTNLKTITPEHMGFNITSGTLPNKMHEGQIIKYKVKPLLGISMSWVTEIAHVKEGLYFVDNQLHGPYKLWYHEHTLVPMTDGVLMKDTITYKPPIGFLGAVINYVIIKKELRNIFNFREKKLLHLFGPTNN
jgi:ligand-binding SRPBCC domain-containing protein